MTKHVTSVGKEFGLDYWMGRVPKLCGKCRQDLSPGPVHDLRVALRRCLSMAGGLRTMDSDRDWKRMKRAGKQLFKRLGKLRDCQVLAEWVGRLATADDPVGQKLRDFLTQEELRLRADTLDALSRFNRKQWKSWAAVLPQRAARVPLDGPAFEHLALEQCHEAYELHRRALRTRSKIACHRLRVGMKRFRYTVESFLPLRHALWSPDLKMVQDCLGDVHDLDVLWATALKLRAFPDGQTRACWQTRIASERKLRLDQYRQKMTGRQSLWKLWRAGLPQGEQLEEACVAKLGAWGSFHTPDFAHAERVSGLALKLYDSLFARGLVAQAPTGRLRHILHAAALMHEVGRLKRNKGYHKASCRLISKLSPPIGWKLEELEMAALVARYHRGAPPKPRHKEFSKLPVAMQRATLLLAGILRLANVFDRAEEEAIQRFEVHHSNGAVMIHAEGYQGEEPLASKLAAARHLLEIACHRPILIVPAAQPALQPPTRPPTLVTHTHAA